MFDITIYYKDGRRSFYDHVISIDDNTSKSIGIYFRTDFDDKYLKLIPKEEIDTIKVRLM